MRVQFSSFICSSGFFFILSWFYSIAVILYVSVIWPRGVFWWWRNYGSSAYLVSESLFCCIEEILLYTLKPRFPQQIKPGTSLEAFMRNFDVTISSPSVQQHRPISWIRTFTLLPGPNPRLRSPEARQQDQPGASHLCRSSFLSAALPNWSGPRIVTSPLPIPSSAYGD